MKKTIAILALAAFATATSQAVIPLGGGFSVGGFIDMSTSTFSSETTLDFNESNPSYSTVLGEDGLIEESDNSYAVDQVEINLFYEDAEGIISGQIDLQYVGDDIEMEQAFFTWAITEAFSVTAGRFASLLGFEAFEPTGLYQFSFAYAIAGDAFEVINVLPNYSDGIRVMFETDAFWVGGSIQDTTNDLDGRLFGDAEDTDGDGSNDLEDAGFEVAGAFTGVDGLTIFGGASLQVGEGQTYYTFTAGGIDIPLVSPDTTDPSMAPAFTEIYASDFYLLVLDFYVLYEMGPLTLGAELVYGTGKNEFEEIAAGTTSTPYEEELDVVQALFMANYALTDSIAITGRVSYFSAEGEDNEGTGFRTEAEIDGFKLTVSPSIAVTDNLLFVAEVSYVDGEFEGNEQGQSLLTAEYEEISGALEAIFSF